jgi:hypothetical protein
MRNALLLAGIWVAIVLIAYAVAYLPDRGPSEFIAVDRVFAPVGGALQFPVPAGWTVVETEFGAEIASPVSALADAWGKIDPCPSCTSPVVESFDAQTWDGQTRGTFTYASRDDGSRVHGVVLGSAPQWGVLLFETGSGLIPQRVSADLGRMEDGFSVRAPSTVPALPGPADTASPEAAEATI